MRPLLLNLMDLDEIRRVAASEPMATRVIAALAADPGSLDELDIALARSIHRDAGPPSGSVAPLDGEFGHRLPAGDASAGNPDFAGVLYIDLAARLIAYEAEDLVVARSNWVTWHNGAESTQIRLRYDLAPDWLLIDDIATWEAHAAQRRGHRLRQPLGDARRVVYGQLAAYLVRAVESARDPEPLATRRIHAAWLELPQSDLGNLAVRDVLLRRREHIDRDVENQAQHWSCIGSSPPGLPRDSAAYRRGGFGTHEIVLYYELVRSMLAACSRRLKGTRGSVDLIAETEWLAAFQQEWLHTPQRQELSGRSPAQVIGFERARLPFAISGQEVRGDCECAICEAMAEDDIPLFMHLDSLFMDPDFAFSFIRPAKPGRPNWPTCGASTRLRASCTGRHPFQVDSIQRKKTPASPPV